MCVYRDSESCSLSSTSEDLYKQQAGVRSACREHFWLDVVADDDLYGKSSLPGRYSSHEHRKQCNAAERSIQGVEALHNAVLHIRYVSNSDSIEIQRQWQEAQHRQLALSALGQGCSCNSQ